jgi:hypothetical protein
MLILSIDAWEILLATNKLTAMGGVIIPIDVLITINKPKTYGDKPRVIPIGSKIGVISRIITCVSRKHPRNNKTALMKKRIAILLSKVLRTVLAIIPGMP